MNKHNANQIAWRAALSAMLAKNSPYTLENAPREVLCRAVGACLQDVLTSRSAAMPKTAPKLFLIAFGYIPSCLISAHLHALGEYDRLKRLLAGMGRSLVSVLSVETDISLGAGSLGSVSWEMLQSAAEAGLPVMAYGLNYKSGRFKQLIVDDRQVELADEQHHERNALEQQIWGISHRVSFPDYTIYASARDYLVPSAGGGTARLRTWHADPGTPIDFGAFSAGDYDRAYAAKRNADAINAFVYPNEQRPDGLLLRRKQELLLAMASVEDIFRLRLDEGEHRSVEEALLGVRIHLNDSASAMAALIFIHKLMTDFARSAEDAVAAAQEIFSYTAFSALKDGFAQWPIDALETLCPQLIPTLCALESIRSRRAERAEPSLFDGHRLDTLALLILCTDRMVTSTENYARRLDRRLTDSGYHLRPDQQAYIFMGCDPKLWQHRDYGRYMDDRGAGRPSAEAFRAIKRHHKRTLAKAIAAKQGVLIDPESLFDMQLGSIHESKRQLMHALEIAARFFDCLDHPNSARMPVTNVFSGKAPANYYAAKEILHFINALARAINRERRIRDTMRVVFVPDYATDSSKQLFAAADCCENLSFSNLEATDRNVFRAMLNGAMNLSSGSNADHLDESMGKISHSYYFGEGRDRDGASSFIARGAMARLNAQPRLKSTIERLLNPRAHEIDYDFTRLYELLNRYEDSFFVLADFSDYAEAKRLMLADYEGQTGWIAKLDANFELTRSCTMAETIRRYDAHIWHVGKEGYR